MKAMLRRTVLALALSVPLAAQTAAPVKPAKEAPPLRVLFIGNSYTAFNNLPKLLEKIAASQTDGPRIVTEASLSGGKTLQWHWDNKSALAAVRKGGWNFVVLQEQSLLGRTPRPGEAPVVSQPELYWEYATRFDEEIRKVGARTVLYATWARDGFPEQQRRLDEGFTQAARKLGAGLVPTGLAWTVAKLEAPWIRLHMPDRSHPTMAGSFLNALIFYQCLTGKVVPNPPTLITGPKWNDPQEVTLVDLPWSDVTILNQIARKVVEQEPLRPVK